MKKELQKAMLLGLGVMSLTKPKIKKVVKEFEKSGSITKKQGEELLSSVLKATEKQRGTIEKAAKKEAKTMLKKAKRSLR